MQQTENQKGRFLIVGLGKTGLSCARHLAAQGATLAVTDTRAEPPALETLRAELPEVALFLGGFDERAFAQAEVVVLSPGVSPAEPMIAHAKARGIPVIGDVELFATAARAPVAAITGSNGKSTVTTLVGEMARADGRSVRVGGNLGTPALELLSADEPDLYVLELSSFQLETTHSLDAAAAVVLNISPDHMDRYAELQDYVAAKERIFRGTGAMVINADDPVVSGLARVGRATVRFGLQPPPAVDFGLIEHQGEEWLVRNQDLLLAAHDLPLAGRHNVANALAASAMAGALGLSEAAMIETLKRFTGLAHRMQWVAEIDGVNWYNDSKGTNVGATRAAVEGIQRPTVLIAGGQAKGAEFGVLVPVLRKWARAVVLIGQDAPRMEQVFRASGIATVRAGSMQEAVARARELARSGDAVLLSPACASFDMFKNYEDRGEQFVEAVEGLAA